MRPGKPKHLKQISLLMPPKDLAKRSIKPKAPDRALALLAFLEVCPKMPNQMLVLGELCAKPRRILDDHDHNANVPQHVDIVPHRGPWCIACHGRIVVACCRHIPAHEPHADGTNHEHDSWHHHRDMPSGIRLHSGSHHRTEKYQHHKDLGHATSKTAPTSYNGDGCTDNVQDKRLRAPELIGHERGASAACEKADQRVPQDAYGGTGACSPEPWGPIGNGCSAASIRDL